MKVIQIIAAYKPAYIYGGPTMSVAKLCEALSETRDGHANRKLEIEVFTTTANGKNELPVEPNKPTHIDGVQVTYFKRLTKDHTHFSPALLWALHQEILRYRQLNKQHKSGLIIHIHAWWNLVSIFSCSMAKLYNVPVVLSPRGMLTAYTSGNRNAGVKALIHNTIGKRLLKYCHIHVTSQKEQEDVRMLVQPKSITVIPNLVDLPAVYKDVPSVTTLEPSAFNMIFLSRIEEKKGLELLFDSLADLSFDWQLTIAGTGEEAYLQQLKKKAVSLKLDTKIKWVGHIKNEDKFKLMAQHDLLVLTSYNENFANVIIESLSVGTPVLLSDQVGLASYVQDKELGWICGLNTESIKAALQNAYLEENKRATIRSNANQIIKQDFNVHHLVNRYITLYKQVGASYHYGKQ